jgi:hypothetical protein
MCLKHDTRVEQSHPNLWQRPHSCEFHTFSGPYKGTRKYRSSASAPLIGMKLRLKNRHSNDATSAANNFFIFIFSLLQTYLP